ncbi:MAG: phospho-N-acetylmuramoyl-pentapeptide-transferase [Ruminococcaceae bacterium]|nr:phospho-N-acetylmuramoyl-pentapeptide-transferase [Oscillospiraceae bacterium]
MTVGMIFVLSIILSLIITFFLEKKFIPFLMRIKMGQVILDIGPRWHKSKEGTPTMGGIFFIVAITLTTLLFGLYHAIHNSNYSVIITLCMMLLFGFIGFIDDYTKFVKKQNQGLTALQKLLLQLVVSVLYVATMSYFGYVTTILTLPFTDYTLELGAFYYVFSVLLIAFTVNSVNLTDGIDGLAGSVTLIISVLFSVFAIITKDLPFVSLTGAVIGGLVGFLWYNVNPARIFMGDTGSLFLGGFVVGVAYILNCPLLVLLAGLWYIVESVSVIIQIFSFKVFHKRVFKMTPIHHHFEMLGWSEHKIVITFSLFTALMCIISYFSFK